MSGHQPVSNPGKKVSDWIGHHTKLYSQKKIKLPTCLGYSRQESFICMFSEANPAHAEFS
jgi:hypothetical protein